jgi:hypothetical protein
MKGKLKPIVDLIESRRREQDGGAAAAAAAADGGGGVATPLGAGGSSAAGSPFLLPEQGRLQRHYDRPTTANLLRRDISTDADVAEAMSRVEAAQREMQSLRGADREGGAGAALARKYAAHPHREGSAEIMVIRS